MPICNLTQDYISYKMISSLISWNIISNHLGLQVMDLLFKSKMPLKCEHWLHVCFMFIQNTFLNRFVKQKKGSFMALRSCGQHFIDPRIKQLLQELSQFICFISCSLWMHVWNEWYLCALGLWLAPKTGRRHVNPNGAHAGNDRHVQIGAMQPLETQLRNIAQVLWIVKRQAWFYTSPVSVCLFSRPAWGGFRWACQSSPHIILQHWEEGNLLWIKSSFKL